MRAVLVIIVCVLGLWWVSTDTAEVRYKVAVSVRDGNLLYTNSSVWSRGSTEYGLLQVIGIPAGGQQFYAEAIPIELPGKGLLMMLPVGRGKPEPDTLMASSLPFYAFELGQPSLDTTLDLVRRAADLRTGTSAPVFCDYRGALNIEEAARASQKPGSENPINTSNTTESNQPSRGCFIFAFMKDRRVSSTFRVTAPDSRGYIAEAGVRIHRVTVTITDEHATERITRYLPWLDSFVDYSNKNQYKMQLAKSSRQKLEDQLFKYGRYIRREYYY